MIWWLLLGIKVWVSSPMAFIPDSLTRNSMDKWPWPLWLNSRCFQMGNLLDSPRKPSSMASSNWNKKLNWTVRLRNSLNWSKFVLKKNRKTESESDRLLQSGQIELWILLCIWKDICLGINADDSSCPSCQHPLDRYDLLHHAHHPRNRHSFCVFLFKCSMQRNKEEELKRLE